MRERKAFDAAVRKLLEEQAAAGSPHQPNSNTERVSMARASLVHALESRGSIPGLPNGVATQEVSITPGLKARLFTPTGRKQPNPMMVYFHGGGWVLGSTTVFAPMCQLLSGLTGVLIASVEYRLAPENKYPAALEDAMTAVRWAAAHAPDWAGDPTQILIGGDSSGANLAAVAGNLLCAEERPDWFRGMMLLFPVTDHPSANHPSYTENARGYGLEANLMRWFWEQYAPNVPADDANVAPLRIGHVPALPSTLIATAEYDVLRDEGIAYAGKLQDAGVKVTHLHAPDMGHNFLAAPNLVARFPQCNEGLGRVADWLKETLAPGHNTIL